MAVVMFVRICRYEDASGLLWSNIRFELDGSGFERTFDTRKNSHFRQGNKMFVDYSPLAAACPVRLLREQQLSTGGAVDLHVFRGFNGKLTIVDREPTRYGGRPEEDHL